jgi:hypothetical protein
LTQSGRPPNEHLGDFRSQLTRNLDEVHELEGYSGAFWNLCNCFVTHFCWFSSAEEQVIARSELTSKTYEIIMRFNQSLFDPSFAGIYAKMLEHPEDLTVEEMVRIDALLDSVMRAYGRECYLVARGIFSECVNIMGVTAQRYFGNRYARSWLRVRKESIGQFMFDQLEAQLVNVDVNLFRRQLDETKLGM